MNLKKSVLLVFLVLAAGPAAAEIMRLRLPGGVTLTFDAPPMNEIKQASEGGRYQYVASSVGNAAGRYNLSVYAEPISCGHGESTKQVTRCFLEKSDLIPGLMRQSRRTACDERSCSVTYATAVRVGDATVPQLHLNTIFAYPGKWVDVHFSILNPTDTDAGLMARLQESLRYED